MKRFKVIGSEPVLGDKQPGETFDAALPEDQESFLVRIGAIKVISSDIAADQRLSDKKVSGKKKA